MATFTLYLPDSLLPMIDEARGDVSRSGWIRLAVENQLADRGTVELRGTGPHGEPGVPEVERSPEPAMDAPYEEPPGGAPEKPMFVRKPPTQRPVRKHAATCTCAVCKPVKS